MNRAGPSESYAHAALDRECAELARTASGRNDRLNVAAFKLGQLVGARCLDQDAAERRLFEAAVSNGYVAKDGDRQARATIRSGLARGALEPRVELPASERSRNGHVIVLDQRPPASANALPAWTPPDAKGKPALLAIGAEMIEPRADEERRHVYRRDGQPVRIKLKRRDGGFLNAYRVRRPADGATGWQFRKPEGFVPLAYTGPAGALDPFDPEHRSEPLFWPEGEKDVDTLVAGGVFAFTFGGSNDVPDEAGPLVAGRDLVILADNDEPGRTCADRKVALARQAGATSVRLVRFAEMGPGQDVSDWLAQGLGTIPDLLDRAEPVAQDQAPEPGGFYRTRPRISASTVTRWIGVEPRPTRFVVDRLVPRGMVTLLAGDGGAGKTLLSQQMMTCCAAGQSFLGLPVELGAAAGLFGEDPDEVIHARQLRICRELDLGLDRLEARLHPCSFLGADLALWRRAAPTDFFRDLEDDLRAIPDLALVVIDSAALVFAGNENDRGEVATFMALLNGLASRLDAAVVLLSHTSKSQADSPAAMASGSTAWVWQARSALRLKTGAEGRPELHHPKANHAKKLDPLALRWSEAGVLVCDPDKAATLSAGGARLAHRPRLALAALRDVILDHGEPAPSALQLPYGLRVVQYEHWRAKLQRVLCEPGDDPGEPRVRKALQRVVDELQGKGIIGRDNPFVWIAREPSA